jgi:hypothetical protein
MHGIWLLSVRFAGRKQLSNEPTEPVHNTRKAEKFNALKSLPKSMTPEKGNLFLSFPSPGAVIIYSVLVR